MSGNSNPMAGLGGGDIVGDIKNWFNSCPPFTKGLLYVCSGITLLNSLTNISKILVNQPYFVVQGFQIQRLIFSPVAFLGILEALFAFLAYLSVSTRIEKEWGTVKTAVDFLWKNFFINITWIAFTYIISVVYQDMVLMPCHGLWLPFFAFIIQTSLANPDGVSMLLCLPIQIKTKYYPIALWLMLSLFSRGPRFDLLIALLVGYIHYKYLNSAYHSYLDNSRMANWSSTVFFSFFKNLPNYVNASGVTIENNQASSNNSGANVRTVNSTANNQPQAPAFRGQGVSIGGASEEPPAAAPKQHSNYMQLNDDSEDLEASGNKTPQ
jgi:hypothetical protein